MPEPGPDDDRGAKMIQLSGQVMSLMDWARDIMPARRGPAQTIPRCPRDTSYPGSQWPARAERGGAQTPGPRYSELPRRSSRASFRGVSSPAAAPARPPRPSVARRRSSALRKSPFALRHLLLSLSDQQVAARRGDSQEDDELPGDKPTASLGIVAWSVNAPRRSHRLRRWPVERLENVTPSASAPAERAVASDPEP